MLCSHKVNLKNSHMIRTFENMIVDILFFKMFRYSETGQKILMWTVTIVTPVA